MDIGATFVAHREAAIPMQPRRRALDDPVRGPRALPCGVRRRAKQGTIPRACR